MHIGDAAAVPALIEALRDEDYFVRLGASEALGKMKDVSAVPVLITILRDNTKPGFDRADAARALGAIGDPSPILALIEAIELTIEERKNVSIRACAAYSLAALGDSVTLPRKTIACSRLTAQERIEVLSALRRVRYKTEYITLKFKFPETHRLCEEMLNEYDVDARLGAQAVLKRLDELDLRVGSRPESDDRSVRRPAFWRRLFAKRKDR